jgi:hypothetical protein
MLPAALAQYLPDREAYDAAWADLITDALRREAKRFVRRALRGEEDAYRVEA